MHIPDGFLATPVWAALDVVSLPAVAVFAARAQRDLREPQVPLLGVMGAFVFAAQMVNFPVAAGTSGHLVGGTLLACTLGPSAAIVVMTAILGVQALVFQDGGILALGANIFNLAIAGVLAGYLPYHYLGSTRWRKASLFLGGMASVLAGACLALAQLLISGVPMKPPLIALSAGVFLVTALLEGAITLAVVQSVETLNPGWIRKPQPSRTLAAVALITGAVLLAAVGTMFASASPDSLEKLAENLGISSQARALIMTPLSDYEINFFDSAWIRKASAGLAGLAIVYLVCIGLGRWVSRQRSA
jgi:cobalt/nickel transport system permease protein